MALLHPLKKDPINRIKEWPEMELKEILSKCDHTLLAQTATWEEIRTFVMTASVTDVPACAFLPPMSGSSGICGGTAAHLHGDWLSKRV